MKSIDFKIELCDMRIDYLKSSLRKALFIKIVSLGVIVMNIPIIYHDRSSWFNAICVGAMISNYLFLSVTSHCDKGSLKIEKERREGLSRIDEDEIKRQEELFCIRNEMHTDLKGAKW